MSAHTIIPGRLYLVRHAGREFVVPAMDWYDAISIAIDKLFADVTP
jgi:hypothetical protein